MNGNHVLALDTANEIVAVAIGSLDRTTKTIVKTDTRERNAFRASNTVLLPCVDELLIENGLTRADLAGVVCGRGPGSFTGVRIALATAKGIAQGRGIPLFGVSTSDAQAWQMWQQGYRGALVVLGDAMRKEVYPVRYRVDDEGPERLNADMVIKASDAPDWIGGGEVVVVGDALRKYAASLGGQLPSSVLGTLTGPTGEGLLLAASADWRSSRIDPDDPTTGDPRVLLPIYTRLSDAEEHERRRFAQVDEGASAAGGPAVPMPDRDLVTGVQGQSASTSPFMDATSLHTDEAVIRLQPLDARWVAEVEALESQVMGSDAWRASSVVDELGRTDRTWWAAYQVADDDARGVDKDNARLIGYGGGWIVDGQVQILKIATHPDYRRRGIAGELIRHIASDARDLGATQLTLEVRASNEGAHRFYERMGLERVGVRPRYYSDREDAVIFTGPLPTEDTLASPLDGCANHDVAGMDLRINEASDRDDIPSIRGGLILAIETSCDETAAAIVDEAGTIVADVVASQIDFHSRFGGVVPEIASRKHIEAIAGVVDECLVQARIKTNDPSLSWSDFAAVSVTYAPGLVGALVVGMAFAKGLAWSADVPLVGVNHLEGHIYANKLARPDIEVPMVVSLVSGGHTMLVHVLDWGSYETLGFTLDDAVGEAFDKVAKAMGLGYPGGPIISRLAAQGDPKAIRFPRALMHSGDLQFSLSGLKTAVMTYLDKQQRAGCPIDRADVAAGFQAAVIDVQVAKARSAIEQTGVREFCLGGGVAANPALRRAYEDLCSSMGVRLTMPPMSACTDNAAMIALVARDRFRQKRFFGLDCDVSAQASLDEAY